MARMRQMLWYITFPPTVSMLDALLNGADMKDIEEIEDLLSSSSFVSCYDYTSSWFTFSSVSSIRDDQLEGLCEGDGYDKNLTDQVADYITATLSSSTMILDVMYGFCPCKSAFKCWRAGYPLMSCPKSTAGIFYMMKICFKETKITQTIPRTSSKSKAQSTFTLSTMKSKYAMQLLKSSTSHMDRMTATIKTFSENPNCTQFIDATSSSRPQSVEIISTSVRTTTNINKLNPSSKRFSSTFSISATASILSSEEADMDTEENTMSSTYKPTVSMDTSPAGTSDDNTRLKTETIWSGRDFFNLNSQTFSKVTQSPITDAGDSKQRRESRTNFGTLNVHTALKTEAITTVMESTYADITIPSFTSQDGSTSRIEASGTIAKSSKPSNENYEEEEEEQIPAMMSTLTTNENCHETLASSSASAREITKTSTSKVSSLPKQSDKPLISKVDSTPTGSSDFALSTSYARTNSLESATSNKGSAPYNLEGMTTVTSTSLYETQKISTESASPVADWNPEGISTAENRTFSSLIMTSMSHNPLEDVTNVGRGEYSPSEATLTVEGSVPNSVTGSKKVSFDSNANETETSNYEETKTATTKFGDRSHTKRADLITKISKPSSESTSFSHSVAQTLSTAEIATQRSSSMASIADKRPKTEILTTKSERSNTAKSNMKNELPSSTLKGPTSSSSPNSITLSATDFSTGLRFSETTITQRTEVALSVTEEGSETNSSEDAATKTSSLTSTKKPEASSYQTTAATPSASDTSKFNILSKATVIDSSTSPELLSTFIKENTSTPQDTTSKSPSSISTESSETSSYHTTASMPSATNTPEVIIPSKDMSFESSATDSLSGLTKENTAGTSSKHVALPFISNKPSFHRTIGVTFPEIKTSTDFTRLKITITNRKTNIDLPETSTSEYRETTTPTVSEESGEAASITSS
ncbi:unnamed protein product, partial [Cylicostephanus goldi]